MTVAEMVREVEKIRKTVIEMKDACIRHGNHFYGEQLGSVSARLARLARAIEVVESDD